MRIKVSYRADRRLGIVEVRTGTSAFVGDLNNFLIMTNADMSESTRGETTLTIDDYQQLKREGATPNEPRRPRNIKGKSYDFS